MVLALPMLFFGCLMFLFGYVDLIEWRSERAALIACGVVLILVGSAGFGSALWVFGSLGRSPLALRIGGTLRRQVQSWRRLRRSVCCSAMARLDCGEN